MWNRFFIGSCDRVSKVFYTKQRLYNDTWIAKGLNSVFFLGSQIFIFNRYGKQLTELDIDSSGWDGMYNGRSIPSDDYWFLVKIVIPNSPVKEHKGHFSLLWR